MAELTRERREEMRRDADYILATPGILKGVVIGAAELRALLDAADERDRLREEKEMHVRWARDLFKPLPPNIGEIAARSRKGCA